MPEVFESRIAMRSGGGDLTAKKDWSPEDRMLPCVFSAKKKVPVVLAAKAFPIFPVRIPTL
jgi:hypothetical protein